MSFRLVTYNIRGGLGMDGRRSIAQTAEVLRPLKADVICLQEVHRRLPWSGLRDQPARLSRLLGMRAIFQSNYSVGVGGFGNAILTRFPVIAQEDIKLPNPAERAAILRRMEGRGLLSVRLEVERNPLTVMCTHWSLDSGDRLLAAGLVGDLCASKKEPVILAGDFNAFPDSVEIEKLRDRSGLIDSDAVQNRLTYPSDLPTARIDYIWHSSATSVMSIAVVETLASDHKPVAAELDVG